jgi:hypothetical protein
VHLFEEALLGLLFQLDRLLPHLQHLGVVLGIEGTRAPMMMDLLEVLKGLPLKQPLSRAAVMPRLLGSCCRNWSFLLRRVELGQIQLGNQGLPRLLLAARYRRPIRVGLVLLGGS